MSTVGPENWKVFVSITTDGNYQEHGTEQVVVYILQIVKVKGL